MCVLPSEQGRDLGSLPVQAIAKFPAKTLDCGLKNPSFLSEEQNKFSWRTGGLPPPWLARTMAARMLSMPRMGKAAESST